MEVQTVARIARPILKPATPIVLKRRIDTLEKFLKWMPEDGFKYEWNNGTIEKSPKMITQATFFIFKNLNRKFVKTAMFADGGEMIAEAQTMTSISQLRIPDLAFFTSKQIKLAASGDLQTPDFAIELVSENDKHRKILEKLDEYFNAGIQVVWLISPELRTVYVYRSPVDVEVCRGKKICSAAPALPDFEISVDDIFQH